MTTLDRTVPANFIAYAKALSIAENDAHTPIIGDWAIKVLTLKAAAGLSRKESRQMARAQHGVSSWKTRLYARYTDAETRYPNEYAGWMQTLVEEQLGAPSLSAFNKWIETGTESLSCPSVMPQAEVSENNLEETVIVRGEVVGPSAACASPAPDRVTVRCPCGKDFVNKRDWVEKMEKIFKGQGKTFHPPKRCRPCINKGKTHNDKPQAARR
jgi:hypothetical protein